MVLRGPELHCTYCCLIIKIVHQHQVHCWTLNNIEVAMIYFIPTVSGADPKIQAVHGYWVGCEDKGISEQTLIQAPQISSPNIYFAAGNLYFNLSLLCKYFLNTCFNFECSF